MSQQQNIIEVNKGKNTFSVNGSYMGGYEAGLNFVRINKATSDGGLIMGNPDVEYFTYND